MYPKNNQTKIFPSPARLAITLVWFCAISLQAHAQADDKNSQEPSTNDTPANEINVYGIKSEAKHEIRGGQSVSITPTDNTRMSSKAHLSQQPSMQLRDSGRVSPSGFALPSIRGQDVRTTQLFVDGELLQDPYSGLPLVGDLDLRAFGRIKLHQGLTPYDLPTVASIGAIDYVFKNQVNTSQEIGMSAGTNHGVSANAATRFGSHETQALLYARHHQSDGSYEYFNDNGTPYNTEDDQLKNRSDNQQQSTQLLPYYKRTFGPHLLGYLGWSNLSRYGLPSVGGREITDATGHSSSRFHSVRYQYSMQNTKIKLMANSRSETRKTQDPLGKFLVTNKQSAFSIASNKFGTEIDHTIGWIAELKLAANQASSKIATKLDDAESQSIEQLNNKLYLGARFRPMPSLEIELKADKLEIASTSNATEDKRRASSRGSSLLWQRSNWTVYGQLSDTERIPSLLEVHGDGGAISSNAFLQQESSRHYEIGSTLRAHPKLKVRLAGFSDETEGKIVFVPSLANTTKARNLSKTLIKGIESQAEYRGSKAHISIAATLMDPSNNSESSPSQIPRIPKKTVTSLIGTSIGHTNLRLQTRYRDKVYRDVRNTIVLPAVILHYLSVDRSFRLNKSTYSVGFNISNLLDIKAVDLAKNAIGESGRTSYTELDGYPLPGRTYQVDLYSKF